MRVPDVTGESACSPYEGLLGRQFASLAGSVRLAHSAPLTAEGTLDVEHGEHWIVPVLIRVMKLPAAGPRQPVRLDVASAGTDLRWTRCIGSSVLRTYQRASGTHLEEREGFGRIAFRLDAADGALLYEQAWIRIGGVRVPAPIAPHVRARVSPAGLGWNVEVTVSWRGHLVCRYAGTMHPL